MYDKKLKNEEFKFKYEQHWNWIKWAYGKHPRDPRQDKFESSLASLFWRAINHLSLGNNELINRKTQGIDFYSGGVVSGSTSLSSPVGQSLTTGYSLREPVNEIRFPKDYKVDCGNEFYDEICDDPDDDITEINNWDWDGDLHGSEWYNNQWIDNE